MSDTQIDNIREVEWEYDHLGACEICKMVRNLCKDGICWTCAREERPAEEPDLGE